jgi:hypothetical protein
MNNRHEPEIGPRTRLARLRRRSAMAALLIVFLAVGFSPAHARASADRLVPFQATFTEQFSGVQCGPMLLCVSITGSGTAAHLGRVTETRQVRIDLSNPATGCLPVLSDTMTLAAANGDQLVATGAGQNCLTSVSNSDVQNEIVQYTVTGGTGRFTGASGSGTWRTHVIITAETATTTTGTATTTASGMLSSPGANH